MIESSGTLDRAGTLVGTACAAHCTISAFAPAVLAAALPVALWNPGVEWGLRLMAVALATVAAVLGFRAHRGRAIAGAMIGSVLVLILAGLFESAGLWATVISIAAGVALALSHFANLRARRRQSA